MRGNFWEECDQHLSESFGYKIYIEIDDRNYYFEHLYPTSARSD